MPGNIKLEDVMRLRKITEADGIVANSPYVLPDPENWRGRWRKGKDRPLCLEIGMGKGRFIIEMAGKHPEMDFIGIERYTSVLFRACEKMAGIPYHTPADELERAGQPEEEFVPPENLRFLSVDARQLTDLFAEDEVDVIFLNFSDPWPKARHADRRLTSRAYLERYEKILRDGGRVEFKTDNIGLFAFSAEEFRAAPKWELIASTMDLHRDPVLGHENVMTEYERKFSKLGNKICKLIAICHK